LGGYSEYINEDLVVRKMAVNDLEEGASSWRQ